MLSATLAEYYPEQAVRLREIAGFQSHHTVPGTSSSPIASITMMTTIAGITMPLLAHVTGKLRMLSLSH